jgi:hypothetical protein
MANENNVSIGWEATITDNFHVKGGLTLTRINGKKVQERQG